MRDRGRVSFERRFAALISFARTFDFPQLPHGHAKEGHRYGARVVVEPFARLPLALKFAGLERPLAMGPRLEEFAGL